VGGGGGGGWGWVWIGGELVKIRNDRLWENG
jgi:hypothetical protein